MSEQVFYPTIAQLAERETVEAKQLSLGHWFESGWTETFLFVRMIVYVQKNVAKESRKTLNRDPHTTRF